VAFFFVCCCHRLTICGSSIGSINKNISPH
jgi:hypothetical protein